MNKLHLFILFLLALAFPAWAQQVTPSITYSEKGLATLKLPGSTVNRIRPLAGNSGQVYGNIELGGVMVRPNGTAYAISEPPPTRATVSDGHDATYSWGTVQERVTVIGNKVKWKVRLENTSADTLNLTSITFLQFSTPNPVFSNNATSSGSQGLGAIIGNADSDGNTAAFVLEQGDGSVQVVTRTYNSYPLRFLPATPGIAPGESRVVEVSLRFADTTGSLETLAPDALERTRAQKPFRLANVDRRPIGRYFLSSAGKHPASNPNGWFNNDAKVDTLTAAGRAAFATRLLIQAERAATRTGTMNGQGNIAWDIEGQRFGHPISYLGLPLIRDLEGKVTGVSLPPEMTQLVTYNGTSKPLIDHFFAVLATGGKTGICIRHTNALTSAFGSPIFPSHYAESDVAQTLIDKISYAKARWGCTLFYIDSNPKDVSILERVALAHPDCVLIPENAPALALARMITYRATGILGQIEPLSASRQIWPEAVALINADKKNFDNLGQYARMLAERRRGAIFSYSSTFDAPENAEVRKIYQEAAQ